MEEIKYRKFSSVSKLNEFVDTNDVKVISIETLKEMKDLTDFPPINGNIFQYENTSYKLWYTEKD